MSILQGPQKNFNMKKHTGFILFSAAFGLVSASASVDCIALSLSVKSAAAAEQSNVLEMVSREVAAAPGCACEIVKAAIEGSAANSKTVAAIVEAAATAAPEQMRLISQCAVAVAPDSLTDVQAVIALLDPNLGEAAAVRRVPRMRRHLPVKLQPCQILWISRAKDPLVRRKVVLVVLR